jgi:hypothetical protein
VFIAERIGGKIACDVLVMFQVLVEAGMAVGAAVRMAAVAVDGREDSAVVEAVMAEAEVDMAEVVAVK